MKKIFLLTFAAILSVGTMITVSANDNVKVLLNDEYIQFDTKPFIEDGRTLVPIRAITEAMGCEVKWGSLSGIKPLCEAKTVDLTEVK